MECRPSQLAFSFNGGKDSTLVLHLLLQAVREWKEANGEQWSPEDGLAGIHTFFFLGKDEFPEVQSFVEECDREHHLSMHTYTCAFKAGLHDMVEQRGIKAVFLGTRHGDPNCQDQVCKQKTLLYFVPEKPAWPLLCCSQQLAHNRRVHTTVHLRRQQHAAMALQSEQRLNNTV